MSHANNCCNWCGTHAKYLIVTKDERTKESVEICAGCAMDAVIYLAPTPVVPGRPSWGEIALPNENDPLPRRDPATGHTVYI